MRRVDLKQSLLNNNRVDQFHDEMWGDTGMSTEVVTASAGATTWINSTMVVNLDGDAANDEIYRKWSIPKMAANDVLEIEARFKIDALGVTDGAQIFGVMLASTAIAGAIADTTYIPATGAFCGIYRANDGTGLSPGANWVLAAQGASETRRTKVLDAYPTADVYQTWRLRLEAGPSTMSIYVMCDTEGLSNLQQLRGYKDPPSVPVAYFENVTLHAANQALIIGQKSLDAVVLDLTVDYVAWARART